ncbi:hypothetical protein [Rothia santali]|uniref:hypothetical protein n=1 Tax=Rothia santali TaxID=2949643 RepID=UPI00266680BD|nr:hypothetical protein [Rothia santali]
MSVVLDAVTVEADGPSGPAVLLDAVSCVLDRAGLRMEDLAAVEIVEAFAAQALAALDELGLAAPGRGLGAPGTGTGAPGLGPGPHVPGPEADGVDARVNARGGALALGHPWGASGAVALVRLWHRLLETPVGSVGVATCAIGGGMGAAMLLERAA